MRLLLLSVLATVACAQEVSLSVLPPTFKPCGAVELGGGFTAPGLQSTPPTWNWGDGQTTQSFFPARHRYSRAGNYTITVSILQGTTVLVSRSLSVTISGTDAPNCSDLLVADPVRVNLRDGQTSRTLTVSRVSPTGARSVLDNSSLVFRSSNASLVSVSRDGTISATGFGNSEVEVEDTSTAQTTRVQVTAGELQLSPPYLRLHLAANPEAQLRLIATRADGQPLDLTGRRIRFFDPHTPPPTPVISVSSSGLIRALRVPAAFNETPILSASVDDIPTSNATVVRVADAFPELDFTELASGRTRFHIPRQVSSLNYEETLKRSGAAQWTDLALEFQAEAAGFRTDRGGLHWFAGDIGGTTNPNDPTVPCGASGNPTRVGVNPVRPDTGCVIITGADPIPHWFVFFHEIGHNYAGQSIRFNQWIENVRGPFQGSIVEGMASAYAQYASQTIRDRRAQYGVTDETLRQFERNAAFPDSPRWRNVLNAYVAAGSRFTSIDPDVFNGITGSLMTEFGTDWFVRFVGVLLPATSRFDFTIANEQQAATFMAASMSAAADRDLRDRFRSWGFPIDDAYYTSVHGHLLQLSKARTPVVSREGIVNAANFTTGAAAGAPPAIASAQWISLFGTSLAPRLVFGQVLSPSLEGTSVDFIDASGSAKQAVLQFVSPGHINVLVPDSLAPGAGQMRIKTYAGTATTPVVIQLTQPGIFSAASSGRGPAAASWLQVSRTDGQRTTGLTFDPNTIRNTPLDLSAGDTYVSFFGTGFRGTRAGAVTAQLGGVAVPVVGAVAQGQFAGLDQLTIGPLPASLAGRGEVELDVSFDGQRANRVSIAVR